MLFPALGPTVVYPLWWPSPKKTYKQYSFCVRVIWQTQNILYNILLKRRTRSAPQMIDSLHGVGDRKGCIYIRYKSGKIWNYSGTEIVNLSWNSWWRPFLETLLLKIFFWDTTLLSGAANPLTIVNFANWLGHIRASEKYFVKFCSPPLLKKEIK